MRSVSGKLECPVFTIVIKCLLYRSESLHFPDGFQSVSHASPVDPTRVGLRPSGPSLSCLPLFSFHFFVDVPVDRVRNKTSFPLIGGQRGQERGRKGRET